MSTSSSKSRLQRTQLGTHPTKHAFAIATAAAEGQLSSHLHLHLGLHLHLRLRLRLRLRPKAGRAQAIKPPTLQDLKAQGISVSMNLELDASRVRLSCSEIVPHTPA
eukprot:CAMPEP_0171503614 /NCGR_PEP_ID=MMETSP0958-20121227/11006_1 /TAXON_ID=87120 /ORGANISM="Aurantiochytrium limacinum, Strain ATCCMYA-1381" /LENGTH=106 /DNA_ID=CAMNT_0012039149 /DNA_START=699 /DNA_END=1019 /DNA_ORIENTATION=-